jgi:predicted site-specific integrase-resolvase
MLQMAAEPPPFYVDGYDRRLVNSVQAAAIAGISRRTLYLWVQLGRVEVTRTASGQLRIFADTLFQRDPRGRRPKSA